MSETEKTSVGTITEVFYWKGGIKIVCRFDTIQTETRVRNRLTRYHTIPTFDDPEKETF